MVGLPLTIAFADSGYKVIGFDANEKKIYSLLSGISNVLDVQPDTVKNMLVKADLFLQRISA
ncbi:MAG TPA: hypothetical protein GXX41_12190 [Thermoanaerobacterium sp.]|nr:hypothetical protein [Thermoanaerobacterium sp.]